MSGRFGVTEREANAIIIEDACLSLRANGYSYDEIAEKLRIRREVVSKSINRALKRHKKQCHEASEHIVSLEEMRLDQMFQAVWDMIKARNLEAISVGLKIMERRAKLRGLDAPTKQIVTNAQTEVPLEGIPLADLKAIEAMLSKATDLDDGEDAPADAAYLDALGTVVLPEHAQASGPSGIGPDRPARGQDPNDPRL